MHRMIRWIAGVGIAAALTLGSGAVPTPAAMAAGNTQYVDDGASNNNGVKCPGATLTNNLSSLTISDGETLYICPGSYFGGIALSGRQKVRIIGRGGPVIAPQSGNNTIISVVNSSGITIQGLVLDGSQSFDPGQSFGIQFSGSSGTISNNHIVRIREMSMTSNCYGAGIDVANASGPVKILKNTIYDFQCRGINLSRSNSATVQSNLTWATAAANNGPTGIYVTESDRPNIAKNSVNGDSSAVTTTSAWGIRLDDSPNAKVSGNKLNHLKMAFFLTSRCYLSPLNQDHVTITGNQVNDTQTVIQLTAMADSSSQCAPSVSFIAIKSNKFISLLPTDGMHVVNTSTDDTSSGFNPVITGVSITGNKYANYADIWAPPSGTGIQDPPAANSGNTLVLPPLGS